MRLRLISLGRVGFALKSLDACSDQAEDVNPTRIKMGFGCNGLGLLPHGFYDRCYLGFITKLCALASGFSSLSLPGLRLHDVVEPDAVLIEVAL